MQPSPISPALAGFVALVGVNLRFCRQGPDWPAAPPPHLVMPGTVVDPATRTCWIDLERLDAVQEYYYSVDLLAIHEVFHAIFPDARGDGLFQAAEILVGEVLRGHGADLPATTWNLASLRAKLPAAQSWLLGIAAKVPAGFADELGTP